MRKATDQRDAQTISLLGTSLLLFHGGDVTCFDACHVIWCGGHSTIFQRGSCIWSAGSVELLIYCSLQVLNGTNLTKYCACHEKWISWLWSASHMKRPVKRYLQCAEQAQSTSSRHKYCACHAKWLSCLYRTTYETSFTMRGATLVTVQHHQILRLPRKTNLMIDPRRMWNVHWNLIYNARSNTGYRPTSANIAPATKF